ncbi:S8 family peptidase [Actinoplanes sp. NBRC 103695]|uniref:S8 family peptidase n=1 Tax=Actinoplanes sp. NBRC 103695 TaxID=3032202 RepID=UPI002556ACB2|nr:S8 family peptidase [Actinoplanes sp. NBRC 103695]
MTRTPWAVLALLPGLLVAPTAASAATPAPEGVVLGADSPDAVPGRYIVTRQAGASADSAGGTPVTYTATMSAAAARRLAAQPDVRTVEQDRLVRASVTQSNPTWGLDRIDQRKRTPASKSFTPTADGSAVHAYVIDTGVRITHRQFGGRASYGYDFIGNDAVADDCAGHGTHVAGILGGATYGVAKKVRIVAVRVLNCKGVGYLSDIIDGVNWVTAHAIKPAVATMSLGATGSSPGMNAAVNRSIASGVTYAVAAGNDNRNAAGYTPASVPAAITVGATANGDRRAAFSNWGSRVDIFAPGYAIRSSFIGSNTATRVMSGTSMATPFVAGAAALILDAHTTYRPAAVTAALLRNATPRVVADPKGATNRLLYIPRPPAPPAFKTKTLPPGTVGKAYAARLDLVSARAGAWRISAGALPAGLRMSTIGRIVGTPTTAGSSRVQITFTDYVPRAGKRTFIITIRP